MTTLPVLKITGLSLVAPLRWPWPFLYVLSAPYLLVWLFSICYGIPLLFALKVILSSALTEEWFWIVVGALTFFATWLYGSMFAADWHRFVLLGDEVSERYLSGRMNRRHWRFMGYTVPLVLIIGVPIMAVLELWANFFHPLSHWQFQLALGFWLFVVLILVSRLSLAYPLVALDRDKPIRRAWGVSRTAPVRILVALVVCGIPIELIQHAYVYLTQDWAFQLPVKVWKATLWSAAIILIQFYRAAVYATCLSLILRALDLEPTAVRQ